MNHASHNQQTKAESSIAVTGRSARRLECRRFMIYALLFAALFLAAHMLGFQRYVNIISGTNSFNIWQMVCGMLYIVFYIIFIGLVPILLIASALFQAGAVVKGWFRHRNGSIP